MSMNDGNDEDCNIDADDDDFDDHDDDDGDDDDDDDDDYDGEDDDDDDADDYDAIFCKISAGFLDLDECVPNQPMDGRTRPIIEMRGRI